MIPYTFEVQIGITEIKCGECRGETLRDACFMALQDALGKERFADLRPTLEKADITASSTTNGTADFSFDDIKIHLRALASEPITTCDDCGACCTYCDSPPGYGVPQWRPENLPDNLRIELDEYYAGDPKPQGNPCLWWDKETKKCKNYDWRPQICRDFERGSVDCARVRDAVFNGINPVVIGLDELRVEMSQIRH